MRPAAIFAYRSALLIGACAVNAQAQASFEVTSIRATEAPSGEIFGGIQVSGSSAVMRNVGPETLIRAAFGVRARFLSLKSEWLKGQSRLDIRATLPNPGAAPLIPHMLETMLRDRFGLKVHFEHQEREVYGLVVGAGGAKVHKSDIDSGMPGGGFTGVYAISQDGNTRAWTSPDRSSMRITPLPDGGARWDMKGHSFAEFATILNTQDGLDVIDMTGVAGKYDFTFTASAEDVCELCAHPANSGARTATLTTRESLQRLGLRLEKRRAPVEILVIDHLDKTPTAN